MFSNAANNSGDLPINEGELRRILASAEGRQLLTLLRSNGGALKAAIEAAGRGDYASAKEALEPTLSQPEARALLEKLQNGES